ncbi:hypothetical protein CI1B_23210 [Bradyrhizobium ivorense]|uniref:Uncharacterized protein n=1 Tax=Bradyrhizobium ivorense TaxID=2511166 RepID=A0A508T4Q8_9BRAD|nr:hypothetical protein CI1B_23210 [Bradyrhizobium ivorense]
MTDNSLARRRVLPEIVETTICEWLWSGANSPRKESDPMARKGELSADLIRD